jgi:hypothetical protein
MKFDLSSFRKVIESLEQTVGIPDKLMIGRISLHFKFTYELA